MTGNDFEGPGEISRDRYGRPMVVPPEGGKAVPYTRATTYVGCLEDTFNLSQWQQRMVAIGLVDRPDLHLAVAAHRDDKQKLNRICDEAKEAASASASATTGTALHALTEQVDRGQTLGTIPASAKADLDAYVEATSRIQPVFIEQFMVIDDLRVGGTPDRIVDTPDGRFVFDVKTGSVDYGMGKIAMQLAMYARGLLYDLKSTQRTQIRGLNQDRAIVCHLPAGTGTCRLLWVDIAAGWEAVQIATQVRAWRARKDLATPFAEATAPVVDELLQAVVGAPTVEALGALWAEHAPTGRWTDAHTEAARVRKGELLDGAAA